ncbi:MAG: hypothetical protein ACYDHM_09970 [Acidiferrobacterales bacterium]
MNGLGIVKPAQVRAESCMRKALWPDIVLFLSGLCSARRLAYRVLRQRKCPNRDPYIF